MYKIVIGIPTYKRPEMLAELIRTIRDCDLNTEIISDLKILVIDNDHDQSAKDIVKKLNQSDSSKYPILYYNYNIKGLSNIRNELYTRSLTHNPDYILSIDDDEFVTKPWLNEMVKTISETHSDIVVGPVIPYFKHTVKDHISCWFKYRKIGNKNRIYFVTTGNFIIQSDFIRKTGIKFDIRFNTTGGEDIHFGDTALKYGAKISWAANAITFETIPPGRTNIRWIRKRKYRGAVNFSYRLKIEKLRKDLFKKFIISLIYIFIGMLGLLCIPIPIKRRYWGLFMLAEGVGGLAGIINIRKEGY